MMLTIYLSLNVINMWRRTIFAQKNSNLKSEILPNKNFQFNQKFNKKILNKKSENQNKLCPRASIRNELMPPHSPDIKFKYCGIWSYYHKKTRTHWTIFSKSKAGFYKLTFSPPNLRIIILFAIIIFSLFLFFCHYHFSISVFFRL